MNPYEVQLAEINPNKGLNEKMMDDQQSQGIYGPVDFTKNNSFTPSYQNHSNPDRPPVKIQINFQNNSVQQNAESSCFPDSLEAQARLNFIRKVYMILTSQLLISIGFCFLSYYVQSFRNFQYNYWWVGLILIVVMYGLTGIILCTSHGRKSPTNIILLFSFTLCFSYILSEVTSIYSEYLGGSLVLVAGILTLALVIALTIFAFVSRNDLNMIVGIVVVMVVSFGGFGILCIFSWNPIVYTLYCAIAIAIAGVLLLIDTKMIIGGERSIEVSMDDYILGALILYTDIMRLFLLILRILASAKR